MRPDAVHGLPSIPFLARSIRVNQERDAFNHLLHQLRRSAFDHITHPTLIIASSENMPGTKRHAESLFNPRRKSARTRTAVSKPGYQTASKLSSVERLEQGVEEGWNLVYEDCVLGRYNQTLPFIPDSQLQASTVQNRHQKIVRIRDQISELWASTAAKLANLQRDLRWETSFQQHSAFGGVRWYQRSDIMSESCSGDNLHIRNITKVYRNRLGPTVARI